MPKRVLCFFCGSYRSRGREHGFAETWLQTLNAGQERLALERRSFGTDTLEDARTQTFDSFLCGDICEPCNTGWMSRLEGAVKPWILSINSRSDLATLQAPARRTTFTRWAVKTACVIDHLGINEIPPDIPRALAEYQDAVPGQVAVLVGWHEYDQQALFALNQRNSWSVYPRDHALTELPPGWFKVAFSIGHLMIIVAGTPSLEYELVVGTGVHVPLWPSTTVERHHWYYAMRLEGQDSPSVATL